MKLIYKTKQVFVNGMEITPEHSQKLINHSPNGFNWGYNGPGPAQLALAILLFFSKDEKFSLAHYQHFKRELISYIPQEDFEFDDEFIERWVQIWEDINTFSRNLSRTFQPKRKDN